MSWRLSVADLARGEAIAVAGMREPMSYKKLFGRAEAVANALRDAGVRAGMAVGLVSAGRAHDEAVGLAGIHLAGGVVIPLDATSPPLRLASILADRGAGAIVHDAAAAKLVTAMAREQARIELDEDGFVLASYGDCQATVADESLACILHTSGSTGKPKAVPITWEGLDAFTSWMLDLCRLVPGDRVLRVAELIFDLAWFDHLATWRAGATLCVMSRRDITTARSLAERVTELSPTIIYGVPSLFTKLVTGLPAGTNLDQRVLCFAGEVFPPRALAEFASRAPAAELYNLFGPTETNVCTFHHVDRAELDGESELPIGVACPYAACRVVGEDGAVVEGPGSGELVVAGPTALGGEYATRDRVERDERGLFLFRGRMDRMVKLRGFRVDPAEVEAALRGHPAIHEAAVTVVEHPKLGKLLHGHVTLTAGTTAPESKAIRAHLAARLAPYMVPEQVHIREELPRTSTGKIDYQAL